MTALDAVRSGIAGAVRSRVVGADAAEQAEAIFSTPGPRWFGPDRPIRRVHADASMYVGGLRALLLQSLHPLAMAAVAGHSDYRGDPWGRLQRTAHFLAVTTYGPADAAAAAVSAVRGVHQHVHGRAPDGRPYRADDPHLLEWVHVAEVDSFLAAYQRYGAGGLDGAAADAYVADSARVAAALGVLDPPRSVAQLRAAVARFQPELRGTAQARDAARFLLLRPPLPLAARPAYGVLAAAAVAILPWWSRPALRLPWLPVAERAVARPAGDVLIRGLRWTLTSAPT